MPTVLVVDDEPDVLDALSDTLRSYGFDVACATTRADGVAQHMDADLVLLDLGLPDGDGLEVCGELASSTPVIVISARADEADRVTALELGADDYLAKPFSARELVARCRSVLRRANAEPREPRSSVVKAADLEIDLDRLSVQRGGVLVDLTTKELEVLAAIARRRGRVVRRQELAEEIWGASLWSVSRTLDVHVSSLRRKLGDPAKHSRYVQTLHGIGFRLLP